MVWLLRKCAVSCILSIETWSCNALGQASSAVHGAQFAFERSLCRMGTALAAFPESGFSSLLLATVSGYACRSLSSTTALRHQAKRSPECPMDAIARFQSGRSRTPGDSSWGCRSAGSAGRKCARTAKWRVWRAFTSKSSNWAPSAEASFELHERRSGSSNSSRAGHPPSGPSCRQPPHQWMSRSLSLRQLVSRMPFDTVSSFPRSPRCFSARSYDS